MLAQWQYCSKLRLIQGSLTGTVKVVTQKNLPGTYPLSPVSCSLLRRPPWVPAWTGREAAEGATDRPVSQVLPWEEAGARVEVLSSLVLGAAWFYFCIFF